jgi:phage terminase large subunit-like protein
MIFFASGLLYRERLFLAANRTGKTVSAAYEVAAHLTGEYPSWWPGRRFSHAVDAWAAGDTRETTRDILQHELLGPRESVRARRFDRGMIPAHLIVDRSLKPGVADCVDVVTVRHVERQHGAPCFSSLQCKSYDQGRVAFQGTSKHVIWLDEEPPDTTEAPSGGGAPTGNGDIYTECLLTFTPLRGLTSFVDHYLDTAHVADANGHVINAKVGLFGE